MTIVSPIIVPLGGDAWSLSWTGIADRVVRVFVNGLLAFGPISFDTAEKSVTVGIPSPGTVEVHENEAGETVPCASVALERRPLIWWRTVAEASLYRIYIDDVVRGVVMNQPSLPHHELILSADVRVDAGSWRTLRVEAVSSSNVETVTDPVYVFLPGLPLEEPSNVEISGGSGSFDIEVTP